MEKRCNCVDIGQWTLDSNGYEPIHIRKNTCFGLPFPIEICPNCGTGKWYNADHENMMHDLQSMNRC